MKKGAFYLLVNLIFFSNLANGKAKMIISIQDCRNSQLEYLSELKVLKDGKIFKILNPKYENQQSLKNLELGTYSLVYKSLFEKETTQIVKITEYISYKVELCTNFIDYEKETYKPIINQLKENDSYKVEMSSQGCFHSEKDSFTITRKSQDDYYIHWSDKSKKLSEKDIESIEHFEIELNYMNRFGCTTVDTYSVVYNGNSNLILDGSSGWDGFIYVRKEIFGK